MGLLELLIVIVLIGWLLGWKGKIGGNAIHILLVVAVIIILFRLLGGGGNL